MANPTKYKKKYKLDPNEVKVLADFENGKFEKLPDSELERYREIARNTDKKDKTITLRITSRDLARAKAKALQAGLPYQTWIASLIHQNV